MNATTHTTALHPPRRAPRAMLAHQLTPQHRGDTPAVLRTLAHHQQARPTTQVQPMLRDCPPPPGVHLTAATRHQLAVDITSGHPGELPRASAVPLWRASCCDPDWVAVDCAHCCPRTGRCGPVFDHTQPRDAHHPARGWVGTPGLWDWCTPNTGSGCTHWTDYAANPEARAGQTGRGELHFPAGMTRTDVSEPNGDRQGRARPPPPLGCPPVPPMAWRSMTTSPLPPGSPQCRNAGRKTPCPRAIVEGLTACSVVPVISADCQPGPVLVDDLLELGGVLRQPRHIPDQHQIRQTGGDVGQDLPAPT
jgi:hypothetical protein